MTSPITAAKNAQGYVAAGQRQRCGTCGHARVVQSGPGCVDWQCRLGGFLVTVYAVCERWQWPEVPTAGR